MKKTITFLTVTALSLAVLTPAMAQQGIHEPGTGLEDPELKQQYQGTGQAVEKQPRMLTAPGEEAENPNLREVTPMPIRGEAGEGNMYGQQNQIHEPGTGLENPDLKEVTQTRLRQGTSSERVQNRRSRVANAVQEMNGIANRNGGLGQQIREMAQNQNQLQEEAETALANAQKRGRFARFFIGPNYGQLKEVEDRLEMHNQRLEDLKELRDSLSEADRDLLDAQISVMEEIAAELAIEVEEDASGFSLFGWLNRAFSK